MEKDNLVNDTENVVANVILNNRYDKNKFNKFKYEVNKKYKDDERMRNFISRVEAWKQHYNACDYDKDINMGADVVAIRSSISDIMTIGMLTDIRNHFGVYEPTSKLNNNVSILEEKIKSITELMSSLEIKIDHLIERVDNVENINLGQNNGIIDNGEKLSYICDKM